MFNSLLQLFKGKQKPFPLSKHIIKEAFECGGVKYFEFDTTANLPWKRGLKFLSIYNEMDMKVDKYYLDQHIKAMDKLLAGKIALPELASIRTLNMQLKERREFVIQEDLVYKIASVVFFDANENPDDWEWKYASEKIERWKKAEDVNTFFLHEPIQRLIPFLNASKENLDLYLEMEKIMDGAHLANIYEILLGKGKNNLPSYTERFFAPEMKASLS